MCISCTFMYWLITPPSAHRQFGWWCVVMMLRWTIPCLSLSGNQEAWPPGPSPTWRVGEGVCGEWVRECVESGWGSVCGEWVRERGGSTFYIRSVGEGGYGIVPPLCREWLRGSWGHDPYGRMGEELKGTPLMRGGLMKYDMVPPQLVLFSDQIAENRLWCSERHISDLVTWGQRLLIIDSFHIWPVVMDDTKILIFLILASLLLVLILGISYWFVTILQVTCHMRHTATSCACDRHWDWVQSTQLATIPVTC